VGTTHANLSRDGYQAVAEHVKKSISRVKGPQVLVIRDFGQVRVYQRSKLPAHEEPYIVGTYNRKSAIESIETDLIEQLNESLGDVSREQ